MVRNNNFSNDANSLINKHVNADNQKIKLMKKLAIQWLIAIVIFPNILFGQKVIEYNFAELFRNGQLIAKNRVITIERDESGEFIRLGKDMVGSAILLPVDDFKRGKIEALVRGKTSFREVLPVWLFMPKATVSSIWYIAVRLTSRRRIRCEGFT